MSQRLKTDAPRASPRKRNVRKQLFRLCISPAKSDPLQFLAIIVITRASVTGQNLLHRSKAVLRLGDTDETPNDAVYSILTNGSSHSANCFVGRRFRVGSQAGGSDH